MVAPKGRCIAYPLSRVSMRHSLSVQETSCHQDVIFGVETPKRRAPVEPLTRSLLAHSVAVRWYAFCLPIERLQEEFTAAQTRQAQDGPDEVVHAGHGGIDEAQGFGDVLVEGAGDVSALCCNGQARTLAIGAGR